MVGNCGGHMAFVTAEVACRVLFITVVCCKNRGGGLCAKNAVGSSPKHAGEILAVEFANLVDIVHVEHELHFVFSSAFGKDDHHIQKLTERYVTVLVHVNNGEHL